ncbi:TonB-dependent receptor [Weeksellaceae bacterium A-14]
MNTLYSHVITGKILSAALLSMTSLVAAQIHNPEKETVIEAVKIVRQIPKDSLSKKISTLFSDALVHDAGKFLTEIPEISAVRKAGNYGSDPVLRGFKYEQLNLVIDGVSSAINACPSRMDPASSQINMNIVQEAEVYKGPYFLRYGNALGGTINFVMKSPKFTEEPKVSTRFSTGYESNGNIFRNDLYAAHSAKKMVWNIFGSYQKGDDYKDGNGNEVPAGFKRYNIGSEMKYKWNESQTTDFRINTNQSRNVDFAALSMNLLYDKTWMYQLSHQIKFSGFLLKSMDIKTFLSDVKHSMGTPDLSMVSDVKSKTYGGRTELKFTQNHFLWYTGMDYKSENAENTAAKMSGMSGMMNNGTSWQNSQIQNYGWFSEMHYKMNNAGIIFSARLDYNTGKARDIAPIFQQIYGGDTAQNHLNSAFSLVYNQNLGSGIKISVLAGRAQRSGSLTERFINRFPVGLDNYQVLGNPHLKPETNNQADLILTMKTEKFYMKLNGFYSYLQDYISGVINTDIKPTSMSSPGVRQMMNIEKAQKAGFEANAEYRFLPGLSSEIAAAYTYGENLVSRTPLPEIAPLDIRIKINAEFNPVKLSMKVRNISAQNRINPDFGELKTSNATLFDFSGNYQITPNLSTELRVENIFDKAYAEHLSRTLSSNLSQRILAPGRNVVVNFSFSF